MKKILQKTGFSIAIILLVGCSTPTKKAHQLIKQHLKETLHDWSSYESVKFDSLDSVFTTVFDIPGFALMSAKVIEFDNRQKEMLQDVNRYMEEMRVSYYLRDYYAAKCEKLIDEGQALIDSIALYAPLLDSLQNNFHPELKGWKMAHSFRANNAAGHKTIHHICYFFDKDITKITDTKDIGENSNNNN